MEVGSSEGSPERSLSTFVVASLRDQRKTKFASSCGVGRGLRLLWALLPIITFASCIRVLLTEAFFRARKLIYEYYISHDKDI